MRLDKLLINANLATMSASKGGQLHEVQDGAIGIVGDRIAFVGPRREAPADALETVDLDGRWITPALIDCHTHLVFAGDRSDEYARRLQGESYENIARSGGGVARTVAETRKAGAAELASAALSRIDQLAQEGVGTVEIKSGYGLEFDSELSMLKAARACGLASGLRVVTTLLAAHAVPTEYAGRSDAYIEDVCLPLIREAAREGLADAVDAYCETIAFSPEQTRRVFETARAVGLPVKLHADQFSDCGGAALAAEFAALSADHLEYTTESGVDALAQAGSVAVLLPGAFYTLRETQLPPIEALRAKGVAMAVATDANPGSSPLLSLLTAANMACTLFGLTVEEALAGITREAARALGMAREIGTIETGKRADLAVWDIDRPAELIQWIGNRPLHARILNGEWQ